MRSNKSLKNLEPLGAMHQSCQWLNFDASLTEDGWCLGIAGRLLMLEAVATFDY